LLLSALQLGLGELLRFVLEAMRQPAVVDTVSGLAPAFVAVVHCLGCVFSCSDAARLTSFELVMLSVAWLANPLYL